MPRGQKGSKPKPVELALAKGDRLILGGEAVIGGVTLRNAARLTVKHILPGRKKFLIETPDGQVLMTSPDELARAGKKGKPIVMQHAYAVTAHASQGATWSRTLWLASHEDSRSALVAMTRHRDELVVFVDRSALPNYGDVAVNVSRTGLADPEQPVDDRSDAETVAAIGKSMERVTAPRNALDVLGLPPALSMPAMSASPLPKLLSPSGAGGGEALLKLARAVRQQQVKRNPAAKKAAMQRRAAALTVKSPPQQPAGIEVLLPEEGADSYIPK